MRNKFIYYGILFNYLYIQIYYILSEVLILSVLIMRWDFHLIPLFLLLFVAIFSILFYRIKKFPIIRFWFIFIVVLLSTARSYFNLPYRLHLLGENTLYSTEIQSALLDYILYCRVTNTIVFLAITCFKYVKMKKNELLQP